MNASTRMDLPTIIAIAALESVFETFLHEGLGHGGACLALGHTVREWGAYYLDCNTGASVMDARLVAAAGSTVNLIMALISYPLVKAVLKKPGEARGPFDVFLWLFFAMNGFTWAGYFLFSGVANIGDWSTDGVLQGVANTGAIRIAMAVFGGLVYFLIGRAAGRLLGQLIGGESKKPGRRLAWTAYITQGVVAVLIGLLNPVGMLIVLISSAASSFGGGSGLMWLAQFIRPEPDNGFALKRSWGWILTSAVAVAGYAAVLGPSLKFG